MCNFPSTRSWLGALLGLALLLGQNAWSSSNVQAQQVDYDLLVLRPSDIPTNFQDYIVQVAWVNNAFTNELAADVLIADENITLARRSWLDQLNANINFSSLSDTLSFFGRTQFGEQGNQFLAPGFNYGVAFNLGGIINRKMRVRVAEQEKVIAETRISQEKLEFRGRVLDRLALYDAARELLRLRRQAELDAETNYTLVQSLYEQNKAKFEDLAAASDVYYRTVEATADARTRVRRTAIDLEAIVGVPIELLEEQRQRFALEQ